MELATPQERKEMLDLKEKTERFFREMENNIRNKIQAAKIKDEIELEKRSRIHSVMDSDDEDGYYYLDDRAGELSESKEVGGISNRNVRFTHHSSVGGYDGMHSSSSVNGIDNMIVRRGERRDSITRESLSSFDGACDSLMKQPATRGRKASFGGPPRRIRTISSVDGEFVCGVFVCGCFVSNYVSDSCYGVSACLSKSYVFSYISVFRQ